MPSLLTPPPETPSQESQKPSQLPVIALVLAIVGIFIPQLAGLALLLGVGGLIFWKGPAYASRRWMTIAAVVLPVLVFAWIFVSGVLSGFTGARAKYGQRECELLLKKLYVAERDHFRQNSTFTTATELGLLPPEKSPYVYVVAGELWSRRPEQITMLTARAPWAVETASVLGTCPDCVLVMSCIGELDEDTDVDVWTISTAPRVINGKSIAAGVPYNNVNDVGPREK